MSELVLVLDTSPTSVELQVFETEGMILRWALMVQGIGAMPHFIAQDGWRQPLAGQDWPEAEALADHHAALLAIFDGFQRVAGSRRVVAIGHRLGHADTEVPGPILIDAAVLRHLERALPEAREGRAHSLAGLRAATALFPEVPQIACFETDFHLRQHPEPDGRAGPARGRVRPSKGHGAHGLSHEYVWRRLAAEDPALARGRIVVAHLDQAASLCAMRAGRSLDSVAIESWETPPAACACTDAVPDGPQRPEADCRIETAEALSAFVWRTRREIGALVAVLGGLDALVFTGEVGEQSAAMRAAIGRSLGCLGITVDPRRNAAGTAEIGRIGAPARVLVRRSDKARMVAEHVLEILPVGQRAAA
ncbi:hypothetical protein [Paracraurococcus lichenis]|uniref:Acetate kinase n=1 Tax=Paracraurococcus lichenis TaxID=3064888 RepID=A0ABT9EE70_9PROT|nr:hypothetical protein [Paracraurococcus sp. LOR1-02]MDO9714305.1 hypothetical protein [Paracraurococcus sp. LOR1-02]